MEESSWEDFHSLQAKFPQLNLEGQVCFHGNRNDTDLTVEDWTSTDLTVEGKTEKKKAIEK